MYICKVIRAKIRLESKFDGTYIHEWFANAKIREEDGCFYAYVNADENSIIYWCIQYGDVVELMEPYETRNEVIKELNKTLNKYKGNK